MKKAVGAILKIVHAEPLAPDTVAEFTAAAALQRASGGGAESDRQRELGQLMSGSKFNLLDPLKVMDVFRRIEATVSDFLI